MGHLPGLPSRPVRRMNPVDLVRQFVRYRGRVEIGTGALADPTVTAIAIASATSQ